MARFKLRIASSDSNDLAAYDRLAAAAKRNGFNAMALGALAEHTADQIGDGSDSWVRYTAGCAGLMKLVETPLVHDVLSRAHIEKNAALVREKSRILARHGLAGMPWLLEPMWLPESFYASRPDLRGARCDNPCLAKSNFYSPCIDHKDILAHYRESVRLLLELAPEIGFFSIGTNDSGAGICWCTGLYPGQNGPDACRDVPMGKRVGRWLKAMLDGARDAGRPLEVIFSPVHFSRDESRDTLEKLPRGARFWVGSGNYANIPFFSAGARETVRRSAELRRPAAVSVNPTLVAWNLEPVVETPFPFFILDLMRELSDVGARALAVGGVSDPVYGLDTVPTMAILSGLSRPPADKADIDRRVMKIAREHAGPRLAGVLYSAWRDVDVALRLWPSNFDTNHLLHPKYSVIGHRWLVRPIVPVPQNLTADEEAYYNKHRHRSSRSEDEHEFFICEYEKNYELDEFKALVAVYDEMMQYMGRAVRDMDAALAAPIDDEMTRKRFRLQRDRIGALRAIWRTQRNVLRAGSIIEYFTGPRREMFRNVERRVKIYYEPGTYKRLFLEAMDDEAENARELIRMLSESDIELLSTGDEQSFVLPRNLAGQLQAKIALMDKYRGDIDVLFAGCPAETFTAPNYAWADKRWEEEQKRRRS